ncbi:outer membrane protein assembly factor [Acinetobacter sp. 187]|uniref:autotransporter assembly complex protein TamA n=1 Tax=Acinetobacter lanii TaxID=2715163 RepID=UPI00140BA1D0|nr:autotransporter assembly complex family protein [Acinetobacter lanii]NHC02176.1 outer membrane protein assembly factor [Acinetobacter lanii]
MPTNIQFKKSMLAVSMHTIFQSNDINKWLCASVFLSVFTSPAVLAAESKSNDPQFIQLPQSEAALDEHKKALETAAVQQGVSNEKIEQLDEKIEAIQQNQQAPVFDSLDMLEQQRQQSAANRSAFKPIEFEDLEDLPVQSVDPILANDILQQAEQAKAEAQSYRAGGLKAPELEVSEISKAELTEIQTAPVNVDQLMQSIQADSKFVVEENQSGRSLATQTVAGNQSKEKQNLLKRLFYKIRPARMNQVASVPKISADVAGAPKALADNIKAKLSSFTVESFADYNAAVPQLRSLTNQAAQAVGYYDAEFKFEKLSDNKVRVTVTPNEPVIVREQNIEFSGAGKNLAQLQVIKVLPELEVGDILDQGKYETTKARITDAAANNGFFDAYWRMHDVMLARPENQADINLKYETGDRYKIGHVKFQMSDPSKPLPIKEEILQTLAPWKDGADYTAWRVNVLSNNLTNSRYFNYTLVDAVKPEPIIKELELPPDLQALVDEQKVSADAFLPEEKKKAVATTPDDVVQNVADENQFAGVQDAKTDPNLTEAQSKALAKQKETERLQAQARAEKEIPVIVTLNADKLNSLEAGIGYGTDTGVRLRSQYRRAIVNENGHSFDANLELSQIRQSLDGRYNIPYKHPLNDYISLVGGYEREERDKIGNGLGLIVESAVAGADRIIKGSRKEWQHVIGLRYRLDRVGVDGNIEGDIDFDDIPDAFLAPGANTEQQSLLFGYEVTKTLSDNRVNPTKGFKQNYKIQLGSESLFSDADMAIANASFKGLYSLGKDNNHQFIAGANLGYIFTKDFEKVPYNLRFLAGGDQSLRGFDYKSLSPTEYGFKVGGQALAVGTVEYNYQFKPGWRAAVFSDFGNAYDEKFKNDTEYSMGLGIRWSSPIGPIRLDVASGVSDPAHPIRLHFFIGSQL